MTINGQNIEVYQGDNKNIIISIVDDDGGILNLTGYNAVWCMHEQTAENIVLQKTTSPGEGITIPDPTNGELVIALEQSDTSELTPKIYGYQCEIEDAFGNHATVTTGYLKLFKSITHHSF
jgi:hypothetical protein